MVDKLDSLLREHVHPAARCAELRRASVGNSQETWFFDAVWPGGSRALVLRRSAAGGTLTWTDRAVEYEALRLVGAAGLPVPPVVWIDASGGALERPYFVMDRVPGTPPRRGDDVSFELGSLLARLHALPADSTLPGLGAADELARWFERYRAVRLSPMPLLGALFGWLEAHTPDEVAPALLWGDAGPHNLLVSEGRITALLDWELAHRGHPLEDVGAAQWACFGVLDPDAILAGYESRAGTVELDALRWFRCLACVTRSVMLLASNRAWVEGTVHRPSLAALGLDLVARNLRQAAREAEWEAAAAKGTAVSPRPDAGEVAAGLARFLAADLLPATDDRALRRELKAAVALLETIALPQPSRGSDPLEGLEERARRLELGREPGRAAMRARLLADLDRTDELLAPLRRLFTGG